MTEFNRKWIIENFSERAQRDAVIYLDIWNEWTETSVQGRPANPIGVNVNELTEHERHRVFVNQSGLVPTHMPWVISTCIDWMEEYPLGTTMSTSSTMKLWMPMAGREVGEIIRQDMWFEKRRVRKDRKSGNFIDKPVMVTSLTVGQRDDPFTGERRPGAVCFKAMRPSLSTS
eukprot:1412409-Amphidinium_carterae.1